MTSPENALKRLNDNVAAGPRDADIGKVFPIIVPRSYFSRGNWPGPYSFLRHKDLGLVWAILDDIDTMVYVNFERARLWEQNSLDWKAEAMENLASQSGDTPWSHAKRNPEGELEYVVMMHSDGLGSSRTLLRDAITSTFSTEYFIGIPDRSCAVLFRDQGQLESGELPQEFANRMHDGATIPMLADLISPSDLELADSAT